MIDVLSGAKVSSLTAALDAHRLTCSSCDECDALSKRLDEAQGRSSSDPATCCRCGHTAHAQLFVTRYGQKECRGHDGCLLRVLEINAVFARLEGYRPAY